MKWLFCLIFGHNKILESSIEEGFLKYFSVCSQCHKKWLNKELSRIVYVESIKIPVQKETKILESLMIRIRKPIHRKQITNIYVL